MRMDIGVDQLMIKQRDSAHGQAVPRKSCDVQSQVAMIMKKDKKQQAIKMDLNTGLIVTDETKNTFHSQHSLSPTDKARAKFGETSPHISEMS